VCDLARRLVEQERRSSRAAFSWENKKSVTAERCCDRCKARKWANRRSDLLGRRPHPAPLLLSNEARLLLQNERNSRISPGNCAEDARKLRVRFRRRGGHGIKTASRILGMSPRARRNDVATASRVGCSHCRRNGQQVGRYSAHSAAGMHSTTEGVGIVQTGSKQAGC